ncbi:MAG: ribosome silencing factor [Pelagibacteraceae bacterium]|nr:ribosome silencing factor [Pelagibacteraceae bacterium]
MFNILDNAKANNIKVISLKNKSSIADYFIIATCTSTRHANSTAEELTKELKKLGIKCPTPEGKPKCDWLIVDAGLIIVHLFRQEIREIYNLEKLWDLSFNSANSKLT